MNGSLTRAAKEGFFSAGALAERGSLRVRRARAPITIPGGPSQNSSCLQEASDSVSVRILKS